MRKYHRTYEQAHQMTEAELQGIVVQMAEDQGWMVHVQQNGSQRNPGKRGTARNATGNGVPDFLAARDGEVLFIEFKTEKGTLSIEQTAWAMALPTNSGPTHYEVIRPGDLARGRVDELLA